MPAFTVDWFSHNIPTWNQLFEGLGWLRTGKCLYALEASLRCTRQLHTASSDHATAAFRLDLGKVSRPAGC